MPLVGVLGAGQLGRMLAIAGAAMGVRFRFLDPAGATEEGTACDGLGEVIAAPFTGRAALDRLADGCDAATFEFENVPAEAVEHLAGRAVVHPCGEALRAAQDRLVEKRTFASCGVPTNATAPWDASVDDRESLDRMLGLGAHADGDSPSIGLPAILKTRRLGYDGKGQAVVRSAPELEAALGGLARVPLLVEAHVRFKRELSIVAVRSSGGACRFYPLVENTHVGGILRTTVAPAPGVDAAMQRRAEEHARAIMDRLGYVGVMALELFEDEHGSLLANEIAPRVHNTGHWTIEAARTSQFENHPRAVLGLPLGDTADRPRRDDQLIGVEPDRARILAIQGASLHWYGKTVRPGRKVGHITCWADTPEAARSAAADALLIIEGDPP